MKMEVRIGDRVELRDVAWISEGIIEFDRKMHPVLYPGETIEWVFGSTIPVIKKKYASTHSEQVRQAGNGPDPGDTE